MTILVKWCASSQLDFKAPCIKQIVSVSGELSLIDGYRSVEYDSGEHDSETAANAYESGTSGYIYFTVEPKDIVIKRGSSVRFDCSARIAISGSPRRHRGKSHGGLDISWLKDGQPLDTETSRFQLLRNGSLRIRKVKQILKDEGVYQCLAKSTDIGTRASNSARLQVAYLNRVNVNSNDNEPVIKVYSGEVRRLECNIEGLPLPSYMWTKNGIQLPQESRFIQLPSGVLEIAGVEASDEGQYQCTAYNMARNRTSPKISLKILPGTYSQGLKILATPPSVVHVGDGETVVLECAASDNPLPQISWVNGDNIKISERHASFTKLGDSYNLQISPVRPQYSGAYICKIPNSEEDYQAVLQVDKKPKLLKIYSPQQTYQTGVVVRIQCEFEGSPTGDVSWTKDGREITEKNRFFMSNVKSFDVKAFTDTVRILKIVSTQKRDSGIYQCFLQNKAGKVNGALEIVVEQAKNPPPPPIDLEARTLSHDMILLKWKRPQTKVHIIGYSAHYTPVDGEQSELQKVVGSNNTNMTIEALEPYTRYKIFMQAYSGEVSSLPSLSIEQTTGETYPVEAPVISCVDPNGPTYLYIKWNSLPRQLARGKITQYRLYLRKHGENLQTEERHLSGDLLEYKVENLASGQPYDMRLQPRNKAGYAHVYDNNWRWTTCTTGDSSGSEIRVDYLTGGTALVSWKSPVQSMVTTSPQVSPPAGNDSGILTVSEYSLSCQDTKTQAEVLSVHHLPPNCYNYTVENLEPEKEYLFSLTVSYGDDSSVVFTHKYFVPGPAHVQISAVALGPYQVNVTWITLQWSSCNPSFSLSYKMSDSHNMGISMLENVSSPVIVPNLRPFTQYNLSVKAKCRQPNAKPQQQQSKVISVRTHQGFASRPENFVILDMRGSSVHLKWQRPLAENGIISHYSIFYAQDDESDLEDWMLKMEFGNTTQTVIKDLPLEKTYYFKVCADTSAGHGEFSKVLSIVTGEVPMPDPSNSSGAEMGIILGVVTGGGCIIMCVLLLLIIYLKPCLKRRCCGRQYSSAQDTADPPPNDYPYNKHTSQDVEFKQPMLLETHIDTKGGRSLSEMQGLSNGHPITPMEMYNGSVRSNLLPFDQETSFGPDSTQLPLTTNSIGESQETADTGYSEPQELEGDDDDDLGDLDDDISDIDTSTQLADSPQNSYPCSCSLSPDTDPLDTDEYFSRQRHHRDCHLYQGQLAQNNSLGGFWQPQPTTATDNSHGQEFTRNYCIHHSASEMVKPPVLRGSSTVAEEYTSNGSCGNNTSGILLPGDGNNMAGEYIAAGHYGNSAGHQQDNAWASQSTANHNYPPIPPNSPLYYQNNTSIDQQASSSGEEEQDLLPPQLGSNQFVVRPNPTSSNNKSGSSSSSSSNSRINSSESISSNPIQTTAASHPQSTSVTEVATAQLQSLPSNMSSSVHSDSNLSIPPSPTATDLKDDHEPTKQASDNSSSEQQKPQGSNRDDLSFKKDANVDDMCNNKKQTTKREMEMSKIESNGHVPMADHLFSS